MREYVHLYIEKFSKQSKEMLLDFVDEKEFILFMQLGDFYHLSGSVETDQPSMLLVHNISVKRPLKQGSLISVDMQTLVELCKMQLNEDADDHPSTVLFEFQNGEMLAAIINNEESCAITDVIPEEFKQIIKGSCVSDAWGFDRMNSSFELRVWDVGQGNTNSMFDGDNLLLFDFGASLYYDRLKVESILSGHKDLLYAGGSKILIISHWDLDHYKLTCHVDKSFLKSLSCVICPAFTVTLTAKKVAERIVDNCSNVYIVNPAIKRGRVCGIKKEFEGARICICVGEESSNKNQSGLLVIAKGSSSVALLTADHTNHQVWRELYSLIGTSSGRLHVVVPHHGGFCGRTKIKSDISPGEAVISVGRNIYGHPKPRVVAEYRNAGYTVKQTDMYGRDIVIKM